MTYTKTNLPPRFLTPPPIARHVQAEATWPRNWSIYAIWCQWDGKRNGMLKALARWAASINHEPELSRQRISQIIRQTDFALRGYADDELGLPPFDRKS